MLSIITNGASEYIMERFSPDRALELLNSGRFTVMPGVPTMFPYLMIKAKEVGGNPLSSLKRCVSAGTIMPPH